LAAKHRKYNDLNNYHFQPVAIETTGVYGKSTIPFLRAVATGPAVELHI